MQSKVLIVILVIVGSMFCHVSAQCQLKDPMRHYNHNLLEGKFYLVATEKAFPYQNREAHCGSSCIKNAHKKIFNNVIRYQDTNGDTPTFTLTLENSSPPGTFNVTGGDGAKFQSVIIGSIRNKVHIIYGCNHLNDKEAVWVYYSRRVQGLSNMDAHSQQYVRTTLKNNNIILNDLQNTDNTDCKKCT